jgi:hypothetical protein
MEERCALSVEIKQGVLASLRRLFASNALAARDFERNRDLDAN